MLKSRLKARLKTDVQIEKVVELPPQPRKTIDPSLFESEIVPDFDEEMAAFERALEENDAEIELSPEQKAVEELERREEERLLDIKRGARRLETLAKKRLHLGQIKVKRKGPPNVTSRYDD